MAMNFCPNCGAKLRANAKVCGSCGQKLSVELCQNPAQAVEVRLCDSSVESVIANLQRMGNEYGIDIWGKEYYTYKGVNRCEVHFGNSKNNTIRFRINDDNTVARALVTAEIDGGIQVPAMTMAILLSTGMSKSEIQTFDDGSGDKYLDASKRNPHMTHYHEKTSIWNSSIQRYVVWDYEVTESAVDIYLYAYK